MKKACLLIAILLMYGAVCNAAEMVVKLKSGNSITIRYSGVIQDVSVSGNDAISGMTLQSATPFKPQSEKAESSQVPVAEGKKTQDTAARKNNRDGFHFRWADPKSED
jgi:hypothetical protein